MQLTPERESTQVPGYAANVEAYSIFPEDQADAPERGFRASEIMNDYVSLADYRAYGMMQDLVFRDGELSPVVVYPDVGYGVGGPYAYPWYRTTTAGSRAEAYEPAVYAAEIAELGPFDYDRLQALWPGAGEDMADDAALEGDEN